MQCKPSHPLVLLVEDKQSIQKVMRVLCQMFGFTLDCVNSECEAISALGLCSVFEVILIDCGSVRIDGVECARQIRKLPHYRSVPIVALTETADLNETSELALAGVQENLQMPFTADEFRRILIEWTHQRIPQHFKDIRRV